MGSWWFIHVRGWSSSGSGACGQAAGVAGGAQAGTWKEQGREGRDLQREVCTLLHSRRLLLPTFPPFLLQVLSHELHLLLLECLQRFKFQSGQFHLDMPWLIRDGKCKDELQSQECVLHCYDNQNEVCF